MDAGCANGLLMESVAAWCAERGLAIDPYGVDISSALAELARRRLPQWADRIWVGNAMSWRPPRPPACSHRLDNRVVSPGGRYCRRPLPMEVIRVRAAGIMTVK
jgi:hypothetical protein